MQAPLRRVDLMLELFDLEVATEDELEDGTGCWRSGLFTVTGPRAGKAGDLGFTKYGCLFGSVGGGGVGGAAGKLI